MQHSKEFLEILDSIEDKEFKNHIKNSDVGYLILSISTYDISNRIRRCPVCSAVFLDYMNFQYHVRRCKNWMKDAPVAKCSC